MIFCIRAADAACQLAVGTHKISTHKLSTVSNVIRAVFSLKGGRAFEFPFPRKQTGQSPEAILSVRICPNSVHHRPGAVLAWGVHAPQHGVPAVLT